MSECIARCICIFMKRDGGRTSRGASVRWDACVAPLPENVRQKSSEQTRAHGASPRYPTWTGGQTSPKTAILRLNEPQPSVRSRLNEEGPNLYSELSLENPLPFPLTPPHSMQTFEAMLSLEPGGNGPTTYLPHTSCSIWYSCSSRTIPSPVSPVPVFISNRFLRPRKWGSQRTVTRPRRGRSSRRAPGAPRRRLRQNQKLQRSRRHRMCAPSRPRIHMRRCYRPSMRGSTWGRDGGVHGSDPPGKGLLFGGLLPR